ncbi:hypothetical protein [Metabacillus litoralis]|uniref:hypothetical protein n=1 Tax=Metabacillus litoralis TaxID=152268 RepID=UPI001CFE9DFA|nr:hypothetical protein [Metabacillus litoralis]
MKYSWPVITCVQVLLWAGYNIIEWLSKKDGYIAKGILFVLFFYLSYLFALHIIGFKKKALLLSGLSFILYFLGNQLFEFLVLYSIISY